MVFSTFEIPYVHVIFTHQWNTFFLYLKVYKIAAELTTFSHNSPYLADSLGFVPYNDTF